MHRVIFWTGLFASRDFDLRNGAAAFRNQFYMPDDRYLGFHCSNEITVTDLGSSVEDFLLAVVTLRASPTTVGPFGKQRCFTVSVPYAQITRKLRYRVTVPHPLSRLFLPQVEHSDMRRKWGTGTCWTSLPKIACLDYEELRKQRQLWLHTRQYKTQLFDKIKTVLSDLSARTSDEGRRHI